MLANDPAAQAKALETALQYSPNNNILLVNLAWDRYLLGDIQGALDAVIPAVNMQWRFPPMYALHGKCYARLGEFENARRVLLDALPITPVDPEVYGLLAILAYHNNDSAQTREYERLNDESAKPLGLGEEAALEARGRLAAEVAVYSYATQAAERLIRLDPSVQRYHDLLAESLYKTGHLDDALMEYESALRLDASWSNAYFMTGTILEEQGRKAEALSRYKEFLRLDSTSASVALARKRIQYLQY
jgi:Flp pilus assembly protein TadD